LYGVYLKDFGRKFVPRLTADEEKMKIKIKIPASIVIKE